MLRSILGSVGLCLLLLACGGSGSSQPATTPAPLSDLQPPQITLNGEAILTLKVGEDYIEAGASAWDERDGSVSVTISGAVGTAVGTYTLTYTATDSAGNTGSVTRQIDVIDDSNVPGNSLVQTPEEILSRLTLEQKVAQMTQPEIGSVTLSDVRYYGIGSVLNGGGHILTTTVKPARVTGDDSPPRSKKQLLTPTQGARESQSYGAPMPYTATTM